MSTRRAFLALCGTGLAAAGTFSLPFVGPAALAAPALRPVMLESLHAPDFDRWLNTPFRLADAPATLTLASVDDRNARGACPDGFEQFALVFRGPAGTPLEQRIYAVEHDGIGRFELFLVPLGPDAEGPRYEAVFNRFAA